MVKPGDSPKIYALMRDIYGNALSISAGDLLAFNYSVYKIVGGSKIAVDGFTNVTIPSTCYKSTPAQYPTNISGLTTSEVAAGYNIAVFPYRSVTSNGSTVWKSPFNDFSSTYELVVNLRYIMSDDALTGAASIDKSFTVRVQVSN